MKSFIFLTNIPTPYRTSFYNSLSAYDFAFKVYYMRNTEADRSWPLDLNQLTHSFYIDKGVYKMFGRYHFHFNPRLIFKILKDRKSDIIVGGGWNDPDVLILVILKRLGLIKNQMHFWTEANYLTLGASNDNAFKRFVRKFVYNCTTGTQLSSGKMTEITLAKWGVKTHKFIQFPNTIEEEKFTISRQNVKDRCKNMLPVFFMPVRLHEQVKGIMNFFSSIGVENARKGIFKIAGDGPDKDMIKTYIRENGLNDHVKLLGHCNTEALVELYREANVFVLGSFTDASPLTAIEAIKMKLPILMSDRCGNHFEALRAGQNGFLFNPYSPESIKVAFESIIDARERWSKMGDVSGKIYDEIFNKDLVISNFVKQMNEYSPSNPA